MREKFEAQLHDAEVSEQAAINKCNDAKSKAAELTEQLSAMKGAYTQKERETDDVRQVLERMTRERDNLAQIIRGEFIDKITTLETECERLRQDMNETRRAHRDEIRQIKESNDAELDDRAVHLLFSANRWERRWGRGSW